MEISHSVALNKDLCKGCTNCITYCPTEAIRVSKGKARIITDRCIDCGECIRRCPHHAKIALPDSMRDLEKFQFKVAIPAPTLYGQFDKRFSIDRILTGLKHLGFDEVFEVAKAAEYVSDRIIQELAKPDKPKPLISSSCPACVRLVQVKYPELLDNIIRVESPMEIAAQIVREKYKDIKDLGIFFISPCPAKITSVKAPLGHDSSTVDRVLSIKDIYLPLLEAMSSNTEIEHLASASGRGVSWAVRDGETEAVKPISYVAVDGINNVSKVLEKIADGRLDEIDYVEVMACPGGCVGGALTVENPYICKSIVTAKILDLPESVIEPDNLEKIRLDWDTKIEPRQIMKLSDDFGEAIEKIQKMQMIQQQLPGLDCSACGAPTCKALAEDIVRGKAEITYCVFVLRERIRKLTNSMMELQEKMPPPIDNN
ncbi:MAG: 4Fe-4S dicluster domain-containing protein [Spirochaetales bacterium]|nr:4Fe-4S dicluster domain-containing protein [Spirochaetales bacterium]